MVMNILLQIIIALAFIYLIWITAEVNHGGKATWQSTVKSAIACVIVVVASLIIMQKN